MKIQIKLPPQLKKIPRYLVVLLTEKSLWCLVGLILIIFLLLSGLFYIAVLKSPPPAFESKIEIKASLYQQVINRLNQREQNIQEGINQEYLDIFN